MSKDKDALEFAGFPESDGRSKERILGPEPKESTSAAPSEPAQSQTNSTSPMPTGKQVARPEKERSPLRALIWIVVVLVGLAILIGVIEDNERGSLQETGQASIGSPSSAPQTKRSGKFAKPPTGTNNVLSASQIRWCLREDIRIEALRSRVNTNRKVSVFNSMVDDYNRRCASFRYETITMERARRDVAAMRSRIVALALEELSGNPSLGSGLSRPETAASTSASGQSSRESRSTREVQALLAQLGYSPGPTDGLYGPRTKAAIQEFQRDKGMRADGEISASLRMRLMEEVGGGCDFKRIMTDADYKRCGIAPRTN